MGFHRGRPGHVLKTCLGKKKKTKIKTRFDSEPDRKVQRFFFSLDCKTYVYRIRIVRSIFEDQTEEKTRGHFFLKSAIIIREHLNVIFSFIFLSDLRREPAGRTATGCIFFHGILSPEPVMWSAQYVITVFVEHFFFFFCQRRGRIAIENENSTITGDNNLEFSSYLDPVRIKFNVTLLTHLTYLVVQP